MMSSEASSSANDTPNPHVNVWASARRASLRRADSSPQLLTIPSEDAKPSFARRSSINSLHTDLQVAQETNGSSHSYSHAERAGFSSHINQCFEGDPSLAHLLPLDPESDDLFVRNSDGLILCKLFDPSYTHMSFICVFLLSR